MGFKDTKEFYTKALEEIHCKMLEERIEQFKSLNLRLPTLEEESALFDAITKQEVRARMKQMIDEINGTEYDASHVERPVNL